MIKAKDEIFKYYFYFMQERMNIFWKRYNNKYPPFTTDSILRQYKFTNVYRVSDRISQYLIKHVIYDNRYNYSDEDILLRIILFKIFNKIETWEFLEKKLQIINVSNFDVNWINHLLQKRKSKTPIYNNAYMMTGTHSKYNHLNYKHEKWLQMVNDEMIKGHVFKEIINSKSMDKVFSLLRDCSLIGDFLAYQYTIDFNYSNVINFNENDFVKAGIGAIRGIKKCFDLKTNNYDEVIRYTHKNLEKYQNYYGFNKFKNLFGRDPTLIDIQNCFCETDKYLRAKLPNLRVGNVRIKQKFKYNDIQIDYSFPPKWCIDKP